MSGHKFPYKTPSDLLRHAVMRHLTWLGTLEPDTTSVMGQVQVVMDLMREEEYHQDFANCFDSVSKTVQRYLAGGHQVEALRTVAAVKDMFTNMPEGFWRDQYLNELRKRFGYLFDGEGTALTTDIAGIELGLGSQVESGAGADDMDNNAELEWGDE